MIQLMLQIKKWAAKNVFFARLIIFICYVLLFTLCIEYNKFLQSKAIVLSKTIIYVCFTSVLAIFIIHDLVKKHFYIKNWFAFHKFACMLVLSLSFLGLLAIFTQPTGTFPLNQNKLYAAFPIQSSGKLNAVVLQNHEAKHSNLFSTLEQILLVALILSVTVILEMFLLAFSCSLSCNGYPFASGLVLIFGNVGVAVLAVLLIIRIFRNSNYNRRYKY